MSVTGLSSATTYYFNILVRDEAGNIGIYTTKSETTSAESTPPTPGDSGTITPANVDVSSLDLNWTAASDNFSAAANLEYLVYYSSSNNIATVSNAEANGTAVGSYTANITTKNVTGLLASTTYYFNVIVRDESGNKAIFSTLTQATTADTTAPTPGNSGTITTSSVDVSSLDLNWTAASDNYSATANIQYLAYYSTSNNITTVSDAETNGTAIGTYSANIITKTANGLAPSTTYYFNLIARDEAGNKVIYSSLTRATAADTTAPTPGNSGTITTSSVADSSLDLNWTAASDNYTSSANLEYLVYYSSTSSISTVTNAEANGVAVGSYAANITTKTVTGLVPSTAYDFVVIVRDEANNKAISSLVSQSTTADVTAPTPGNSGTLAFSAVNEVSLTLSWTAATDNNPGSTITYQVYRSTTNNISTVSDAESNGTLVGTAQAGVTKNVTGLSPGTTYYFNVIVKDNLNNKSIYTTSSQATDADVTAPTPGNSGNIATVPNASRISLSWTAASDTASNSLYLQYLAYYSTTNNLTDVASIEANGTAVGTYTSNITSVVVDGLDETTTYYVSLIVKDEAGNKAAYSQFSETTTALGYIKKITTGELHNCAILSDNSLKCWGAASEGRLGLESSSSRGYALNTMGPNLPKVNLGTDRYVIDVSSGYSHSCAILDNNSLKCWGRATEGQLGYENTSSKGSTAGTMGDNLASVNLGTGRYATKISVGDNYSCAILDNRTVKCWGNNTTGQLGQGHTNNLGDGANEMGDNLPIVDLGTGRTARDITTGTNHSCALLDNYTVKCWGDNTFGQLGLEDTNHRGDASSEMGDNLAALDLGTNLTAIKVAAGDKQTCALLTDHTVKCWGNSSALSALGYEDSDIRGDGASEMGDNLPSINLGTGLKVVNINLGNGYSCALLDNRKVKCWGKNTSGQLGLGDTSVRGSGSSQMGDSLPYVDLGTGAKVREVFADKGAITCALLMSGRTRCWGYAGGASGFLGNADGSTGNIGDGPSEMGDNLRYLDLESSRFVRKVVAGQYHNCALLDNSGVKCWGDGTTGQLGYENTASLGDGASEMGPNLAYVDLGTGLSAVDIAAGGNHNCALLDDHSMKCWGKATAGSLGNEDDTNHLGDAASEMGDNLPVVNLGTGRKVMAIEATFRKSCALLDNGDFKCWGENTYGSLGQGDTTARGGNASDMGDNLTAIDVGTNLKVMSFTMGQYHSCAIVSNGDLKCWGRGFSLGYEDSANRGDEASEMGDNLLAVNLGTGLSAMSISATIGSTCAILSNGDTKCYGQNFSGELGAESGDMIIGQLAGHMGDNLVVTNLGTSRKARSLSLAGLGDHVCALRDDSSVVCWGKGNYGQLGNEGSANIGASAGDMGDNLATTNLGTGLTATSMASGNSHTCAILSNGSVKCWGYNSNGQLGYGDITNRGGAASTMGDDLAEVSIFD